MRPIDANALEEILHTGLMESPHEDRAALAHHRIEYMHFLDVIRKMPTIAPPPNDPLTLEELREMDGEPVWVCHANGRDGAWMLVCPGYCENHWSVELYSDYGKTWTAFRRKPEEDRNAET